MKSGIRLTVYIGEYGQREETVALLLPDGLAHDLREPMELSNEPFALMIAGAGRTGDFIELRRKSFQMRRDVAEDIGRQVAAELIRMFGARDEVNGYKQEHLTERERERHGFVRGDRGV